MLLHSLLDILRNSVLITGLVVVMMMMIEALNIESHGRFFSRLRGSRPGQILFGATLGLIPGCIGGFATVSLYTHGLFSFGALIAMMIASSGDEAFVMLAMFPEKALILFAILFVLALISGFLTDWAADRIRRKKGAKALPLQESCCPEGFALHEGEDIPETASDGCGCPHSHGESGEGHDHKEDPHGHAHGGKRHWGWKRAVIAVGLAAFIAALGLGYLEHDHEGHEHGSGEAVEAGAHGHNHEEASCIDPQCCPSCSAEASTETAHEHHADPAEETAHEHHSHSHHGLEIDLLNESWMNVLFALLSLVMLGVILFAPDHFVEEHLWHHVICKHLPTIFLWTFGILAGLAVLMHFVDISSWISDNTALMILLATLIGIIPESGPHLIFVTLYASGLVPFPVLLASSISQDGHASIPLLAESKKSFLWAKVINCAVALVCGYTAMLFM